MFLLALGSSPACHSTALQIDSDQAAAPTPTPAGIFSSLQAIDAETGELPLPAGDPKTGELPLPAGDPKTDTLRLKNGDSVTCEILSLDHGLLTAKTESMGTVSVEWVDVLGLESHYQFRIETVDKETYYGTFAASILPGKLVVDQDGFQVILDMLDVVLIEKFKSSFLDRITGYVNFGFNFSEATTIRQLNFGAGLQYKSKINILSIDLSTIATSQDQGAETSRADLLIDFKRFFTGGLYGYGSTGLQHNSEMGIALRTSLGLGAGVAPVRTSIMDLTLSAGINGNNETALSDGGDQISLEGVLSSSYSIFVFQSPKTDLSTSFTYYPNITNNNRYRLSYDIRVRQEIVSDLFIDLKFYLSYDSDPPSSAVANRDYGFITGIGYSW